MADKVRPVTLSLFVSVIEKTWPSPAVCVDFGIDSKAHLEALALPILNDEITMQQLDAALGVGEKITKLVAEAPSNPHKDIRFHTSWDVIMRQDFGEATQHPRDSSRER